MDSATECSKVVDWFNDMLLRTSDLEPRRRSNAEVKTIARLLAPDVISAFIECRYGVKRILSVDTFGRGRIVT